ncbi:DUF590 family protein [Pelomyxa schiedti]|nr:DUF590 family protein [Pelomyxa schiedti]
MSGGDIEMTPLGVPIVGDQAVGGVSASDQGYYTPTPDQPYQVYDGNRVEYLLESFMGVSTPMKKKKKVKVPPGYKLKTTKSGCRYLKKIKDDNATEDEDDDKHIPKCCGSKKSIGKYYGTGVELYFRFLIFIIGTNVFGLLCILVNFIPHCILDLTKDDVALDSGISGIEDRRRIFYLSSYTSDTFYYWLISSGVYALSWFFCGWVYFISVARFFKHRNIHDHEDNYIEDEIPDNEDITHFSRCVRGAFSFFVFVSLLAVSAGCTFGLTILEKNAIGSRIASTAVALVVTIVRLIWAAIATGLTKFERHTHWSSYKEHVLFKWYSFKVLNVVMMYISRWLVMVFWADELTYDWNLPDLHLPYWQGGDGSLTSTDAAETKCGLVAMGDQFLMLIVIDLLVSNAIEVGYPLIYPLVKKCFCCCCTDTKINSRKDRPEFDLAEEYLEILYRQFVIYLGMPFFPLITLLALLANVIEVGIDRLRLTKICKKPPALSGSMKKQLIFYMFVSAVLACGAFPVGTAFIFTGYSYARDCPGGFWPWSVWPDSGSA